MCFDSFISYTNVAIAIYIDDFPRKVIQQSMPEQQTIDEGKYVDWNDEIDEISSGRRQISEISSHLKYRVQDGSQQGDARVAVFPL